MKLESDLKRHICEYYEARILSGYCRCGDPLPSIHKVSAAFQVSVPTVRDALTALEQQGYVTVDARKAARVTCRIPLSVCRQNAAEYFVPRADGILDLVRGGHLLLLPCWNAGIEGWKKEENPFPSDVIAPHVVLYITVLNRLQNRLLINLYWEILHYARFPFLMRQEDAALSGSMADRQGPDALADLCQGLTDTFTQHVKSLFTFIEEARIGYSLEQTAPVPFQWRIYRHQPQLRYSFASHLIRGIMYHRYPVGSKLPSLSCLAKQHGISVNTVRRTLNLLEKLGVVESHQGKRSTVRMEAAAFDVDEPEIREGLRLYLDALHIVELTLHPVMLHVLENASPKVHKELETGFAAMREQGKSNTCFEVIFAFIIKHSAFAIVRECYNTLLDLITWGFPLALYRLFGHSLHEQYLDFNIRAERHLQDQNWSGFSYDCMGLMSDERRQALAFISQKSGRPTDWQH